MIFMKKTEQQSVSPFNWASSFLWFWYLLIGLVEYLSIVHYDVQWITPSSEALERLWVSAELYEQVTELFFQFVQTISKDLFGSYTFMGIVLTGIVFVINGFLVKRQEKFSWIHLIPSGVVFIFALLIYGIF